MSGLLFAHSGVRFLLLSYPQLSEAERNAFVVLAERDLPLG